MTDTYLFNAILDYKSKPEQSYNSGYISGDFSLERTLEDLNKHIAIYQDLGYIITGVEIHRYCPTCKGNGEVFQPYKRSVHGMQGKNVKCPTCKGKESDLLIEQWKPKAG